MRADGAVGACAPHRRSHASASHARTVVARRQMRTRFSPASPSTAAGAAHSGRQAGGGGSDDIDDDDDDDDDDGDDDGDDQERAGQGGWRCGGGGGGGRKVAARRVATRGEQGRRERQRQVPARAACRVA